MICMQCEKDMADCVCADAAERILKVLGSEYLYIGPEYRKRLLKRANAERPPTEPG